MVSNPETYLYNAFTKAGASIIFTNKLQIFIERNFDIGACISGLFLNANHCKISPQQIKNLGLNVCQTSKVFVIGLPKIGSTSIHEFFRGGGRKSADKHCGECIEANIQHKRPPVYNTKDRQYLIVVILMFIHK